MLFVCINATHQPEILKEMLQQFIYRMFNKC